HDRGKQIRAELKGDRFANLFDVQARGIDVKKEIAEGEKKLASPRYADVRTELGNIDAELRRARKAKRKATATDAYWYSLWGGPPSVRELAHRVGMLSFYEILYRSWSS